MRSPRGRPWLVAGVWLGGVLVPDVLIRGPFVASHGAKGALFYLGAAAFMAIFWTSWFSFLAAQRVKRPWLAWTLLALAAASVPLVVVGTLAFHRTTGTEVSRAVVEVAIRNPRLALSLIRPEVGPGLAWLAIAGIVGAALIQRELTVRPLPPAPRPVLAAFVALSVWMVFDFWEYSRPPPADMLGLRTVVLGSLDAVRSSRGLPVPNRTSPAELKPAAAPDVLLVVHESVSNRHWAPWAPGVEAGAEIAAFAARHADHSQVFKDCKSAAGMTNVALPALLTGLEPDSPAQRFASAPLIWNWARSAGYRTGLFSSQEFESFLFPTYFLGSDKPDVVKVAADYAVERTVEGGVDERLVVDSLLRFWREAPREPPKLAVIQFNSTHVPCWAPGTAYDDPARCRLAAAHVGRLTAELLRALEDDGSLERTLVIVTSDHGEVTGRTSMARPTARLDSMEEAILSVPLLVHLPREMAPPAWIDALQDSASRRVASIDVVPTVLDLWGRWPGNAEPRLLPGVSLIREWSSEPRPVVATNTGEIRDWNPERFVLYLGRWKWLIDTDKGVFLYDLERDPGETDNLAAQAPAEASAALEREAARRAGLRSILERARGARRR